MSITLYHNPRCSKSRASLKLLRAHAVEPRIVEYLRTPPDEAALRTLLKKLKLRARDIIRTHETPYAELGLADESLGEEELIRAIAEHPILLQRPIAVAGERAVVGRPPEKVLDLV